MWARPAANTAVFYFLAVVALGLVVWGDGA